MDLTPKEKRKLEKLAKLFDEGDLAIAEHLLEIEERLEEEVPQIKDVLSRVRGDKGDKGEDGEQGPQGERGEDGSDGAQGPVGPAGKDGRDGKDGKDGKQGKDGERGKDGKDGKDGSPDTPDDVVEKIKKSSKKIPAEKVEMDLVYKRLADTENMARANAMPITTTFINGRRAKNFNFTGVTPTYDGDTVTIPISAGGSMAIGEEVTGASANRILYTDDNGDLSTDSSFTRDTDATYMAIVPASGKSTRFQQSTDLFSLGTLIGAGNKINGTGFQYKMTNNEWYFVKTADDTNVGGTFVSALGYINLITGAETYFEAHSGDIMGIVNDDEGIHVGFKVSDPEGMVIQGKNSTNAVNALSIFDGHATFGSGNLLFKVFNDGEMIATSPSVAGSTVYGHFIDRGSFGSTYDGSYQYGDDSGTSDFAQAGIADLSGASGSKTALYREYVDGDGVITFTERADHRGLDMDFVGATGKSSKLIISEQIAQLKFTQPSGNITSLVSAQSGRSIISWADSDLNGASINLSAEGIEMADLNANGDLAYIGAQTINTEQVSVLAYISSVDDITRSMYANRALVGRESTFIQDLGILLTADAPFFTGAGLDDLTAGAAYSGTVNGVVYKVEIDGTGTPDTFKWYKDGVLQASTVAITGAVQTLSDGQTVTFGATTGHTLGNFWTITIDTLKAPLLVIDTTGGTNKLIKLGDSSASIDGTLFFIDMTDHIISAITDGIFGVTSEADVVKFYVDVAASAVGINTDTPSAQLHIAAGSATAGTAPIKLTSGTLNTTAEAGAIEFLTDDYYGTRTTNAVRSKFVTGTTGRATGQTAANASVQTYANGAADASFEVSANILVTTSSAENFTVTVAYTDEGNTARTLTLPFVTLAGTSVAVINFANGAIPYEGVALHIRVKASTTITVATTGTFTGATYNVESIIKKI
jgi:hypothetical protein